MKKIVGIISALLIGAFVLSGCTQSPAAEAYEKRLQAERAIAGTKDGVVTLEQKNLAEKQRRDERPNQIGYVYLLSFGKPFGYYVVKGKISSSGSQVGPEDEVVQPCSTCDRQVVDGPQDDKTYGDGDPGIFFYTPDGNMVVTSLDYFYSEQPVAFGEEVINLSAKK